jgi:hypothetical protein
LSVDPEPIVVASGQGLQSMGSYLLSGDREQPAVALTLASTGEPVLAPEKVRAIVGSARIYLVTGTDALLHLEGLLGSNLALPAGAARIWWPELAFDSDPLEHPVVLQLEDEPEAEMLTEFVRCFELTRPVVRRAIKLIEDSRALLEHELKQARNRQHTTDELLRDTQVERHKQTTRAENAEARLTRAERERDALRSSTKRAPEKDTGLDDEHD